MQFSESWLRSLVDPALSSDELSHTLTMAGLEVEEVRAVAPLFEGVVVGAILGVESHPDAERLKVCRVDIGSDDPVQIVCGAPNVVVGMKAPLARVGAKLPGEANGIVEIRRATMRGVASDGMLCSARELGISDDHGGLLALPQDAAPGQNVRAVLDLDDRIFTIKLTPNKADCLSLLGIAREVAAITGAVMTPPPGAPVLATTTDVFPVRISSPDGCGRFTGRVIRNVDATAPTPEWMRRRLERAGQRSISALVDVTNYVMLELGRPLHVYDLNKLRGGIDVRFARAGEILKLLNEQSVTLTPETLAITDDSGPIGLAGIMGGDSTKAETDTRDIFLEAAFFHPSAIAGRARRYGFSSDASHRFERGVDFDNNLVGIERATQLVLDICGGDPGPVDDTVARLPDRKPVRMRAARARKVIGIPIANEEMESIFARLKLPARREGAADAEAFVVTPPSWRFDLEIEEDLIEEVARLWGFERIPAVPQQAPAARLPVTEKRRSVHGLRTLLAALGYHEVINFGFVDAEGERDMAGNAAPIAVRNPIASQLSVMRTLLIPGLVANLRYNINRKSNRVRVFEIGRVFLRDATQPDGPLTVAGIRQPVRLAGASIGTLDQEQWGAPSRSVDFFDAKGDVEALLAPRSAQFQPAVHPALHPGRSARVVLDGVDIGWVGELHPRWQQKLDLPGAVQVFELDAEALQTVDLPIYREVSRFPPVRRDLSFEVAEEVPVESILQALRSGLPPVVEAVELFDLYRGKGVSEGKKSLAIRVLFQDTQKTLTDAEVHEMMDSARFILQQRFDAHLRQ